MSLPMVCVLSPCLSLTEQQRHLLQQQEQQLQQLQQLLASPQLTPVTPLPSRPRPSPAPPISEGRGLAPAEPRGGKGDEGSLAPGEGML